MAINVSLIGDLISDCETADFSAGSLQDAHVRSGVYALGEKVSQTTSALITKSITSYDATGKGLLFHVQVDGTMADRASGGVRLYVADALGNNGYWYFGKEDVIGDFTPLLVDPSSTPTTGTGTIDVTQIVTVGIQFNVLSKSVGNNPNAFWDQVYWIGGAEVTSAASDAITFRDIYDVVYANAWGGMVDIDGALFSQMPIFLGSNSAGSIDFDSVGEILNWLQRPVSAGFYKIEGRGNAGGTSDILIDGAFVRAGTSKYDIDLSSAALDSAIVQGSTFQNADAVLLAAGGSVTGTVFDGCGEIDPSSAVFQNITIKNSAAVDAMAITLASNVSDLNFSNNNTDVRVDEAGTYSADNWQHSGSVNHADNSTVGAVTLNVINGGNTSQAEVVSSGGGSITVSNDKQMTVTGLPSGVEVRIRQGSFTLAHQQSVTGGQFVYAYAYTGDRPIKVTVGGSGWQRKTIETTLKSVDFELAFDLEPDPSYI